MPTPFEILITARKDTRAIPQTTAELKDLQSTAEKTGKVFDETGSKSENYGRALARGVHIAQASLDILAPAIGKLSPAFDSAIRSVQQFGGAMSLAFSYGGWGVTITAVTAALGLLIQALGQQAQATAAALVNNDMYLLSMRSLGEADKEAATKIKELADVMAQQQDRLSITHLLFGEQEQSLGTLNSILGVFGQHINTTAENIDRLKTALDSLNWGFTSGYDEVERGRSALADYGNTAHTAAGQVDELTAAQQRYNKSLDEWNQRGIEQADTLLKYRAGMGTYGVSTPPPTTPVLVDSPPGSNLTNTIANSFGKIKDAISGMVSGAMAPTYPTPEEMGIAGAGGQTPTHWDEFARQAEAVAKGTDPAKYAGFAEKLAGLKDPLTGAAMSAEQAAKAFRDMSLFANPDNMNVIEWGPVIESVKTQMAQMEGAAEAAKKGFKEVWASMAAPERQKFADALDVDPSDVKEIQKLVAAGADPKAIQSAKMTGEIADNIKIIEGTHTAIIDITKSATFDAVLAEILDDLAKIPASADVVVTMTYETAAAPGAPAGPVGGEANAPGPAEHAQHGGSWIIPPGFNENYPIYGSSGERVTVLPADMSDSELDYFVKKNFGMLEQLYNANPQYWMGIAASHPGWGKRDWYEFIFGNQWGHFKLSDLGIPPAGAGGNPTTSKPGDSYHAPVYNAPVYNNFTVYPRDYESLMRDARAAAAHGA